MKIRKLHIILIGIIAIIIAVNFYNMAQPQNGQEKGIIYSPGNQTAVPIIENPVLGKQNSMEISTKCNSDSDCSWQITNCCTENSGGSWGCIGKESKIECNELVLCPQVLSPKPKLACVCIQGGCALR